MHSTLRPAFVHQLLKFEGLHERVISLAFACVRARVRAVLHLRGKIHRYHVRKPEPADPRRRLRLRAGMPICMCRKA